VGHNIKFKSIDEAVEKYLYMKKEEMENLTKKQLHLQIISDMVVDDESSYSLIENNVITHACQGKVLHSR